MSLLTPGGLPDRDHHGNIIQPDYRNMIRLEALLDSDLPDNEKTYHCLALLYSQNIPKDIPAAMGELEWFYHCGDIPTPSEKKKMQKGQRTRLYDFEEDANHIYAAFRQAYQLDISIKGPPLHWWEFMALFACLPEGTTMAQRLYYRGVDLNEYKGEQRETMLKTQKAVALKNKKPVATSLHEIEKQNRDKIAQRFAEAEKSLQNKRQRGE